MALKTRKAAMDEKAGERGRGGEAEAPQEFVSRRRILQVFAGPRSGGQDSISGEEIRARLALLRPLAAAFHEAVPLTGDSRTARTCARCEAEFSTTADDDACPACRKESALIGSVLGSFASPAAVE